MKLGKVLVETLKRFGIKTEKELDEALKESSFSLGIMAAGTLPSDMEEGKTA